MRDTPSIESIEILGLELRDQLSAQLRHFEGLDAKAGVLLGFAGLLVVFAPTSESEWIDAARLAGIMSAVSSLLAFHPRRYPMVDLRRYRQYLWADPLYLRRRLLDTYAVSLDEVFVVNAKKARRLRMSVALLVVAITLAFGALAVESNKGGHHGRTTFEHSLEAASGWRVATLRPRLSLHQVHRGGRVPPRTARLEQVDEAPPGPSTSSVNPT